MGIDRATWILDKGLVLEIQEIFGAWSWSKQNSHW